MKGKRAALYIARAGIIAALYAGVTLLLNLTPLGVFQYGPIQFRVSEALTLLAALTPAAIPGLFVGCLLANIVSGAGIWDVIFGSLATLLAAWLTWKLRKNDWLAALPPVAVNGLVVGSMLTALGWTNYSLWITILTVAAGEAAVCYLLGVPLLKICRRLRPDLREN
ncbi:MAG: QueT transporter family protein [Christensenellales bacterium]